MRLLKVITTSPSQSKTIINTLKALLFRGAYFLIKNLKIVFSENRWNKKINDVFLRPN